MSEQGRVERKPIAPDQLIIDGKEHRIPMHNRAHGYRKYYEIRIGDNQLPIILPPRLFILLSSLAILRDTTSSESFMTSALTGFVHQSKLGLSKSLINQYVYCTRLTIRQQANQALIRDEITSDEFDQLVRWRVFESAFQQKLWNYWRCVINPDQVFLGDHIMRFPDVNLVNLAADYYLRRRPGVEEPELS